MKPLVFARFEGNIGRTENLKCLIEPLLVHYPALGQVFITNAGPYLEQLKGNLIKADQKVPHV